MEIAITVTAVPSHDNLLLDVAAALQRELNGALAFRWLGQGEAIDLILHADTPSPQPSPARGEGAGRDGREGVPPPLAGEGQNEGEISQFKQIVAEATANYPVDWCVQPSTGRKKRMLIADMDSTTIGQESFDEMAELKGIKPEIAAITERSMRGELKFEAGFRERMRLLRGMSEGDLQRVLGRLTLNPGARTLVQTMKSHGAHTVLVSGGLTFFSSAVAERAGFAANRGNVILWDDGHLVGAVEPVQGREAKLAALNEEAAAHGILPADVIAVGDGANDLAMLKAAGLSIAYRAMPIVAGEADTQVRYTDLTALLYFQGYTRDSFVA
jgi:phosphoserine phosphatase